MKGSVRSAGAALVCLAGIVLWTPLPIGSVLAPGVTTLEVLAGLALALATTSALMSDGNLVWNRSAAAVLASVSAVALLGFLQSRAWPPSVVEAVAPTLRRLQEQAALVLQGRDEAVRPTLSVASGETARVALLWLAVAASLGAAAIVGSGRRQRRWLAGCLIGSGLFQVLYGGLTLRTGRVWGVEVGHDPTRLRGTFVNPDHMALYLEMALAVCFAWGALRWSRRALHADRSLVALLPWALWLLLFVGLAFSGSRGGLIAALLAAAGQGLLWHRAVRTHTAAIAGAAVGAVGVAAVAILGLQQGFGRLLGTSAADTSAGSRLTVYSATLKLWTDFPATGTGLGTFQEAFTLAQPDDLRGLWTHAHNDYLELLLTTGIVGLLLLAPAVAVTVRRLLRLLTGAKRSEDRAAALAALGALAAVALHSGVDFGLTTPANAATLAILCGSVLGVPLPEPGEIRDPG